MNGDVAQVVELLPNKSEALISNPSTAEGKKEGRKEGKKEERKEGRKEGRKRNFLKSIINISKWTHTRKRSF
jgi:flagellar biosynthesis/type III secretory pathway protein FliH